MTHSEFKNSLHSGRTALMKNKNQNISVAYYKETNRYMVYDGDYLVYSTPSFEGLVKKLESKGFAENIKELFDL